MTKGTTALLDLVTFLVADVHPDETRKLASLIREKGGKGAAGIRPDWVMTPGFKERLGQLSDLWQSTEIGADELAGILVGASHAYHLSSSQGRTIHRVGMDGAVYRTGGYQADRTGVDPTHRRSEQTNLHHQFRCIQTQNHRHSIGQGHRARSGCLHLAGVQ